ncbi:L-histidine N(alpha)-methyltransferase [Natronospira bacteriovora]|uniref:L-histidine N(Alpha)-methyltransferase n=1 Tax=Natronospira bacteriovora TaxID=3069753 RepID=A0ABU0W9B9_9GAMM|nr:L-histidine N(alpha)-methyltransferase [Natronospira sp. AB-CW4]MDQ2070508.1 L-histidine N(alpha)-methyltransferase [Natronospira sp. AB-CW4]
MSVSDEQELQDQQPTKKDFMADVKDGLSAKQKWISSMYFYDAEGSMLFDRICELTEYYPTRTELQILNEHMDDIAAVTGPQAMVIEPGSGSSLKTRRLLAALREPAAYVPVEISREHLLDAVQGLRQDFPALPILPVCADFTSEFDIPEPETAEKRRVVYFPGSTIGNFDPADAVDLLKIMKKKVGREGGLIIGVDLRKDRVTLEKAYNDRDGITALFNLNLLHRINRELGGNFDVSNFSHRAEWNDEESRIEMHLVSEIEQDVTIGGDTFHFDKGEYILSECSYKFTFRAFEELAGKAGWTVKQVWTDNREWFSVQYLE